MSETDTANHKTSAAPQAASANEESTDKPWTNPKAKPFIKVEGISKYFGDFCAVDNVDLSIYKGELFSILGASGCGKTTLLRVMAGFEKPSSGRILIDGVDITAMPPYLRPVNMMFQSYALFPHMSVEQNVAYGLKRDGVDKQTIRKKVDAILELVQLQDFKKRKPHQLSGGEGQRVALARALVKQPKVLLLDEPLAALDKKLREQTQFELANIQYDLGVTFVVVTHDQEEAMTLSSRIAIMDRGDFVQIGTPHEVYENPANRFAADFVGMVNLFDAKIIERQSAGLLLQADDLDGDILAPYEGPLPQGATVTLALRPEKIFINRQGAAEDSSHTEAGIIDDQGYFGRHSVIRIKLASGKIIQVSAQNRIRSATRAFDWNETVTVSWDLASFVVLTQ